jgi:hypothetical protein
VSPRPTGFFGNIDRLPANPRRFPDALFFSPPSRKNADYRFRVQNRFLLPVHFETRFAAKVVRIAIIRPWFFRMKQPCLVAIQFVFMAVF